MVGRYTGGWKTSPSTAKHADWWNLPGATPGEYAHKLTLLETLCTAQGRSISSIRKTWMGVVSIASTQRAAVMGLNRFTIWPGDTPLVGTPGEIRSQIAAYQALGVNLFILAFADEPGLTGLNMFIDEVV